MESIKLSAVAPRKSKLARTFAKVLHLRALTEGHKKIKAEANFKVESNSLCRNKEDEEIQERLAAEALFAKVFASISFVKASYAQLQFSQSPYDPDGIEAADKSVVSELKNLSELKQCYLKKQSDPSPEKAILAAELKELQSVNKTFEIMGRKLESQVRLKESEIIFLREKLEEATKHNRSMERRLNQSGSLSMLDNLHISGLSSSHFINVLRHTVRSIRSFVRLIVAEMRSVGWDIDGSVNAIHRNTVFWKEDHKCFAIESFVCREMFDSFHFPNFSIPCENPLDRNHQQKLFFERFNELKYMKAKEFLSEKPRSSFAKFCRVKFLRLVHPKMESSFFGNLRQRDLINAGEFPDTSFFTSFAEMAKRVWLLHCLAFSFVPQASIFQVKKGCRFSDVYMECVNDDDFSDHTQVAFTVVPGFKIYFGKESLSGTMKLEAIEGHGLCNDQRICLSDTMNWKPLGLFGNLRWVEGVRWEKGVCGFLDGFTDFKMVFMDFKMVFTDFEMILSWIAYSVGEKELPKQAHYLSQL